LEVRVILAAGIEPLVVDGTVAYVGLADALQVAAVRATAPWAERYAQGRGTPLQLVLELTQARADRHKANVEIEIAANLTARETVGHIYRGQTRLYCARGGEVSPAESGPLVDACLASMARDAARWLEGVVP
jgi:hypothetical protein